MIFEHDDILSIHAQAISAGLHQKRNQMLFGVNSDYVAGLDQAANPGDQLLLDLHSMNQVGAILGGVPLERWLRNAAYATSTRPEKQQFFREWADKAAISGSLSDGGAELSADTQQERILFVADLLPFGFLAGATQAGRSVARIIVPRYEGGQARTHPTSNDPMLYYGTGWLIGPKHVITNHHVINARNDGEGAATREDFEIQANHMIVEFDYDQDGVPGEKLSVTSLSATTGQLDYAIVELGREPRRTPLPLWGGQIDFSDGSRLPVNIIQHPGGQPKQMAIRNNLAAAVRGADLAYYTDTKAGSSGSPVCNDRWQVLALHKASTVAMGRFTYQGKETAWVNIGTTMDRIIADLSSNNADLWARIGATVV